LYKLRTFFPRRGDFIFFGASYRNLAQFASVTSEPSSLFCQDLSDLPARLDVREFRAITCFYFAGFDWV
jgi:hypothetical protein